MAAPDREPRHVVVDERARIGAEQLDQRALLDRREVAAPDVVVTLGTTGVHHHRPGIGQRVFEGQVDLIGPARDGADRADRRVHHHGVARGDAELAKPAREFLA
jgi:hypothetical protein